MLFTIGNNEYHLTGVYDSDDQTIEYHNLYQLSEYVRKGACILGCCYGEYDSDYFTNHMRGWYTVGVEVIQPRNIWDNTLLLHVETLKQCDLVLMKNKIPRSSCDENGNLDFNKCVELLDFLKECGIYRNPMCSFDFVNYANVEKAIKYVRGVYPDIVPVEEIARMHNEGTLRLVVPRR